MQGVRIRQVDKRYGQLQVLKDLSLEVEPGDFTVLLGPSGCGKSTLLSAIAGLDDITSGTIEIGGRDVTDLEPKDRGIAMVFQSYALYPTMTVRENLSFGLRMNKVQRDEIDRRVTRAADLLQIDDLLDRRPSQLSGGQRQRVAIGRALVREAGIFLFDEPLSNLDAKLRVEMRVEIKKLHDRLGMTAIYVTHDQIEAMTMATRIAVMRQGRIEQYAEPQELYDRPQTLFVAGFIGSPAMNFLPATLRQRDGGVVAEVEGHDLPLHDDVFSRPVEDGMKAILGVRPEHIAPADGADGRYVQSAAPVMTEPMGADSLGWFDFGGRQIAVRLVPERARSLEPDQKLAFDLRKSSVFCQTTEERL
ncbi:sn-glycerol-3-phosphate ABC transporter ATP-binding protein UgpC [Inquilinus sp. CAU 1745]|uniref:ABC transporter ATP-binding protein n=1 Tax=Inquilinus sp. CAU 1745 TaxID=3140369 RepID=UPI00325A672F